MSVKNGGAKTDNYSSFTPSATSPTERDLDRGWGAERLLNNGKDLLAEPIDPGKVVEQIFVFDVPTDTTMAYMKVFSGGYKTPEVKVKTS